MKKTEQDAGTIAALMLRFKDYRLPRAKRLLKRVNEGETLTATDIDFLKRMYNDSKENHMLVKRNPKYNDIIVAAADLYTEIITKGLENEKNR